MVLGRAANADLILHRIQHLGGGCLPGAIEATTRRYQFFQGGNPAAATFAHRNAAAGFDGQVDYRRWRSGQTRRSGGGLLLMFTRRRLVVWGLA